MIQHWMASNGVCVQGLGTLPPDANPFSHDAVRMGTDVMVSKVTAMWAPLVGEDQKCEELVLVHGPSGKRVRLLIDWNKVPKVLSEREDREARAAHLNEQARLYEMEQGGNGSL